MEPQPDVRENISKALIAGLQAGAEVSDTTKKGNAAANVAAISALATAAVQRSVALEYMRTGVFAICQQKYNQAARNPRAATNVSESFEADDLKFLFYRAAEIAIAEALASAARGTPAPDGKTPSETMVEQIDELTTLYNKVKLNYALAGSGDATGDAGGDG